MLLKLTVQFQSLGARWLLPHVHRCSRYSRQDVFESLPPDDGMRSGWSPLPAILIQTIRSPGEDDVLLRDALDEPNAQRRVTRVHVGDVIRCRIVDVVDDKSKGLPQSREWLGCGRRRAGK